MPKRIVAVLWVIAIGSFAVGLALVHIDKAAAAFYLLPARAWELALGALIASGGFPKLGRKAQEFAAWLGLALIAAGLLITTPESSFPAPWALLPCVGTALLIAYGKDATTARLLSLPPLTFVGDISYSLYLWHWPVMAFWRLERGLTLDTREMIATIALSFVLAILSYRLIERPLLDRTKRVPTRRVLWIAALAMLAVTATATLLARHAATTPIADPRIARVLTYLDYDFSPQGELQFQSGRCMADSYNPTFDAALCATLQPDRPNIMVLGDSHAGHIVRAIGERLVGSHVMQVTASGCRPVWPVAGDKRCTEVMALGFGSLPGSGKLGRVIVSARWEEGDIGGLIRAIRRFEARGVAVTVLGPAVEYDEPLPRILARAIARDDAGIAHASRSAAMVALDREMAKRLAGSGATYVSMQTLECPDGICPLYASDGAPFHFDYGHYTLPASRELVARMDRAAIAAP